MYHFSHTRKKLKLNVVNGNQRKQISWSPSERLSCLKWDFKRRGLLVWSGYAAGKFQEINLLAYSNSVKTKSLTLSLWCYCWKDGFDTSFSISRVHCLRHSLCDLGPWNHWSRVVEEVLKLSFAGLGYVKLFSVHPQVLWAYCVPGSKLVTTEQCWAKKAVPPAVTVLLGIVDDKPIKTWALRGINAVKEREARQRLTQGRSCSC